MPIPIVLLHGYSADGRDFKTLCEKLTDAGMRPVDLNIGNYVSLNNEISIKDIAEGFDRALRNTPQLDEEQPFDAIVHSTGMLVIRSWLTNYGAAVGHNDRLKRLKHLIGLAPATWGSPQAHKGRTWIGALVKGNREPVRTSSMPATKFSTDWNWEAGSPGILRILIYLEMRPITIRALIRPMFASSSGTRPIREFRASPRSGYRWNGALVRLRPEHPQDLHRPDAHAHRRRWQAGVQGVDNSLGRAGGYSDDSRGGQETTPH